MLRIILSQYVSPAHIALGVLDPGSLPVVAAPCEAGGIVARLAPRT